MQLSTNCWQTLMASARFYPSFVQKKELPDIVIWNESMRVVYLIELTVCFDENFADQRERKLDRYHSL